jgi:hypothetical protein
VSPKGTSRWAREVRTLLRHISVQFNLVKSRLQFGHSFFLCLSSGLSLTSIASARTAIGSEYLYRLILSNFYPKYLLWLLHRTIIPSVLCCPAGPALTLALLYTAIAPPPLAATLADLLLPPPDPVTATVGALALSLGLPLSFPSPSILRPGSDTFCVPLSRSRTAVHTVGSSYLEPRQVS